MVQTKSLPLLAAWKPARDKKKGTKSTHRHGKRTPINSNAEPLTAPSVSLPLSDKNAQPTHAALPRLRLTAVVAAFQRLEKTASPVCHRVPRKESVSSVSANKPGLPELATVPKKKAEVRATKPKSPEFIEFSSYFSKSSDDPGTPMAVSRGSLPSRGKKAAL